MQIKTKQRKVKRDTNKNVDTEQRPRKPNEKMNRKKIVYKLNVCKESLEWEKQYTHQNDDLSINSVGNCVRNSSSRAAVAAGVMLKRLAKAHKVND